MNDFEEDDYLSEDEIPLATSLLDEEEDEFQSDEFNSGGDDPGSDEEKEHQEELSDEQLGITPYEIELSKTYDDIVRSGSLRDVVTYVVAAMPSNSSSVTIGNIVNDIMNSGGRKRVVTNAHISEGLLKSSDIDVLEGEYTTDNDFNNRIEQNNRDLVWRFIEYLASADLSKCNAKGRENKQRRIPAFIIYLFSCGLYGLLINCPTLPKIYKDMVDNALFKLNESKYDLVEELAQKYEEAKRPEVANRVRQLKLVFLDKEPAELANSSEVRDLKLTSDDISIYKSVRNKYVNISKSITQEVASDLIEVVVDEESGITKKLKDKVRGQAITEVKAEFIKFAENNKSDIDTATNILFNN